MPRMNNPETGHEVTIIGRHVEVTDAIKAYAQEKVDKVERFAQGGLGILDVMVTLDIQKMIHKCDILVKIGHTLIKVSAREETIYAAIDIAVDKMMHKIRHYHSRIVDHHKKGHVKGMGEIDMEVNVIRPELDLNQAFVDDINDEIEEENRRRSEEASRPHEIVSKKSLPLTILTQQEALMKMELSEDNFLIFRHEVDKKLNLIYRRDDGHYGIIDVEPKS